MAARAPRLVGPFGASAVLHAGIAAAIIALSTRVPVALPPIYKVDLVGAPAAAKPAAGIVTPAPTPPTPPQPKPPPPAHETPAPPKVAAPTAVARPAPPKATPSPPVAKPAPPTAAATHAASRTGNTGTDVATVRIEGIEFPFPGYLQNIVRQVALNFSPDDPSAQLHAEVAFIIRRDGSVAAIRLVQRSGDYGFDLEAQGAIEKAAASFGPLPDGFHDDALPVVFSFDPRLLH